MNLLLTLHSFGVRPLEGEMPKFVAIDRALTGEGRRLSDRGARG